MSAIRGEGWQYLDEEARERFLLAWLPELNALFDLLTDFRCAGFRVLGDLLMDVHEENEAKGRKQLIRENDSESFSAMMQAYLNKRSFQSYRDAVSVKCRELLDKLVKPTLAVRYVVACGKRNLLWDLLLDALEPNILEVRDAE